jgi:hypothetical protein
MINDLNQAIDDLYQGENISSEMMKTIGTALLRERQGRTPEQIGAELNLSPKQVEELVIRARGWEIEQEQQER